MNTQICVEVLWPSQPNRVMSSMVSLPNHTFTGQACPLRGQPVLCTFFRQKNEYPEQIFSWRNNTRTNIFMEK